MANNVVISGIGQSEIGRRVSRSGLGLTVDATLQALDDAGLTVKDIDGLSTFPGYCAQFEGFSPVSSFALKEALGLQLDWYSGGIERPGQIGAIIDAYAAIKAGLARHVICFRTIKEGSGGASYKSLTAATERVRVGNDFHTQWLAPFNAPSTVNHVALHVQRHFELYGTTRQQMAQIALVSRRNAALNPNAVYRAPMTMDDYLASRMISTPLCLYDCDVPVDASTVIILSHEDAARDLKSQPIRIEAVGGGMHGRANWDQSEVSKVAAFDSARKMWSRTDLKASDVDIGLIYDGFSFLSLIWLEALGFCGIGESGAFVEGGQRISRDGELPINPHGGQLSAGRVHGFGFAHEAVVQLRGEAGARQIERDMKVAAVTMGAGPMAGCMLLVKD